MNQQHVEFIPEHLLNTAINRYNKITGEDWCLIWNNEYCYARDMSSDKKMDECDTIDFVFNLLDFGPEIDECWDNVAIYHDMFRKVYIIYWETRDWYEWEKSAEDE